MANEHVSQNFAKNPDPQVNQVSGEDITLFQAQQPVSNQLPNAIMKGRRSSIPLNLKIPTPHLRRQNFCAI
jgi:hypothetical protein